MDSVKRYLHSKNKMGFKIHSVASHFPKKTENINFLKFGDM